MKHAPRSLVRPAGRRSRSGSAGPATAPALLISSSIVWRHFAITLAVRGPGAPRDLTARLKTILADADPSVRIGEGGTAQDAIDAYLYPRRLAAGVLAVAELAGLLLASIGIYGVVSYSVAQRVCEFGVRPLSPWSLVS